MAGFAGWTADVVGVEGETFEFSLLWSMTDGNDFPWADCTIEYAVHSDGCRLFNLTQANGITVDPDAGSITFSNPTANLRSGTYEHECVVRDTDSGLQVAGFDGRVVIARGTFR